jgi:hypothetical protein
VPSPDHHAAHRPTRRPSPIRSAAVLVALAVVAVLTGCQLQVDTTITVDDDGSGRVTQAVGLDDAALARIGDLEQQVAVADLEAAGWTVEPPVEEGDLTWVRAHKDVADTTELAATVSQLNGPGGPFRDLATGQSDSFLDRTTEVNAVFDLTGGPALFTDPELAAVGGDPWGTLLAQIEAETGRPVTEMVDFSVTVELPGGFRETWTPTFADATPTEITARSSESKVVTRLVQAAVVVLVLVVAVALRVAWVARRRRTRRMMAGRYARR